MAIQFVVEDGTGLTTSTSYIDVADFRQYWDNRGIDYSTQTDDEIKVDLNKSAQYMDGLNYQGKVVNYEQSLSFPRYGICDRNYIDKSGTVPQDVKDAQAELSGYSLSTGNELDPVISLIQSRSLGPASVTYIGGIGTAGPVVSTSSKYLGPYLRNIRVGR